MNVFDLVAKITMDTAEYDKNLTGASEKTTSFGDRLKSGLATAGKIGAAAVGAVTVATTAMTGAIVKNTGEVAEYGDNIDKMSQKMGMSAEAYQEWDAIMQHSGTSIESLQSGMKTLANAVENGNGAFERLGITQEEIAGMNNEELFSATITALQNVENETERTYLAGQLLGRGATELGALLNTSAEDTEAMRQRVHELGGVMSNEAVKAAAAYQDSLQDMTTAFSGLKRGMISEFLPSVTTVMDGLTELFSGNSEGGLGQIKEGISGMVDQFSETVPQILDVGSQLVVSLASAVTENLPTLISAGADAVLTIGKGLLEELPSLIGAGLDIIVAIADGIADALPELIPTIVDVVMQIVDKLTDPDTLSGLIDAGIEIMIALAMGLIDALPKLIERIPQIITNLVTALVDNAPKIAEAGITLFVSLVKETPKIIGGIVKAIPEIIGGILGALGPLGGQLAEVFTVAWNGIKGVFSGVGSWFSDKFSGAREAAANAWGSIKNRFSTSWEDTKKVFSGVGKWASDTFSNAKEKASGAWEGLKDRLGSAWETAKGAFSSVKDWADSKFSGAKDAAVQAFSGLKDGLAKHWEAAKTVFSSVSGFFTTAFSGAKEAAASAFSGIRERMSESWGNIKGVFSSVGSWFSDKFSAARESAGSAFSGIKAKMSESWDGVKMVFGPVGDWFAAKFESAKQLAGASFTGIRMLLSGDHEAIKKVFSAVNTWFGSKFEAAKSAASSAFSGIKSLMSSHWDSIKGVFSVVGNWFSSTFEAAKGLASSAFSGIKALMASHWEGIKGAFAAAGSWFSDVFGKAKDMASSAFSGIKALMSFHWDGVKGVFSGIGDWFRERFAEAKDKAVSAWSDIKSHFEGIKEKIKSGLNLQEAFTWGRDMVQNFIDGITQKWEALKTTVSNLAGTVKDFIGFSEPKRGPLSNFHTYAPDMISLFIKGIRDNQGRLWKQIAKTFGFDLFGNTFGKLRGSAVGQKSALDRFEALYKKLDNYEFLEANVKGMADPFYAIGMSMTELIDALNASASQEEFSAKMMRDYSASYGEYGKVIWDEMAETAREVALGEGAALDRFTALYNKLDNYDVLEEQVKGFADPFYAIGLSITELIEALNASASQEEFSARMMRDYSANYGEYANWIWDNMAEAARAVAQEARTGEAENSQPITINVYPSAGMDEERLADLIDRKLAERLRRNRTVFA